MVRVTHHPAIYELDGEALRTLQRRLREQRGKMRTFVRQKRREARGKAEARGASFPGDAEQPRRRKQVFAAALKRVAKELGRLRALEARTEHVEAARQALARARTEKFVHHPAAGDTPRTGAAPAPDRSQRQARARQHHWQHPEGGQGCPGRARRQALAAGVEPSGPSAAGARWWRGSPPPPGPSRRRARARRDGCRACRSPCGPRRAPWSPGSRARCRDRCRSDRGSAPRYSRPRAPAPWSRRCGRPRRRYWRPLCAAELVTLTPLP